MSETGCPTDTVFVVKENQEHCFLFERDDLLGLYHALQGATEKPEAGITRREATEVLEGLIPERIRSI